MSTKVVLVVESEQKCFLTSWTCGNMKLGKTLGICKCDFLTDFCISPKRQKKVRMQKVSTILNKASKASSSCQKAVRKGV